MSHHLFRSEHGEGEHDGACNVVMQTLTHEQLLVGGIKLQPIGDAVKFLTDYCNHKATNIFKLANIQIAGRNFWAVKDSRVDGSRKWECKPILKAFSMYRVCGYSTSTMLRVGWLSCFYGTCMQRKWRRCVNKGHVDACKYYIIEPKEY